MNGKVKIRLMGIFKKALEKDQIIFETQKTEKLRDIIQKIVETSPELRRVLIDPELGDPRPNAVILVNGREISVLEGLETEIGDRDEIVLIPVAHGG
ncbi:MAG: MoaD/ThiS family protein [Nitrososphaerota archaeon]